MEWHDVKQVTLRDLGSPLGTEITGLDARMLGSPTLGALLHRVLLDHQLVLLRGLDLTTAGFRRLGGQLGPLRRVPWGMQVEPDMPDVQRLSNLDASGAATGANPDPYSLYWHTDGSATRIPSRFTLLYAVCVPDQGGETHFADMHAACAALAPARRRALIGRFAIHDPDISRHFRHGRLVSPAGTDLHHRWSTQFRFMVRMISPRTTRHPVICQHEETGRPCLYIGDHAWRVTRCNWRTGVRLVNELNTFATTNPDWIYTHAWRSGDLLIWDNRCLLHRGSEYDTAGQRRVILRAVVNGSRHPPVPARE